MNILPPRIPTNPIVASAPVLGAVIAGIVIADWKEARQYHLRCHCESCGAVWAKRGRYPGWCPNCGSDAANWLSDDWNDLDDPWMGDGDIPPEDIEDCRITNY